MVPSPPFLAYYPSFVVNFRPSADSVWHVIAIKCFTIALVQFLFTAEDNFVGVSFYDSRMGQGGCSVLVPLGAGVRRAVDHYGFATFLLVWALNSVLAYSSYRRSAEINGLLWVHFPTSSTTALPTVEYTPW